MTHKIQDIYTPRFKKEIIEKLENKRKEPLKPHQINDIMDEQFTINHNHLEIHETIHYNLLKDLTPEYLKDNLLYQKVIDLPDPHTAKVVSGRNKEYYINIADYCIRDNTKLNTLNPGDILWAYVDTKQARWLVVVLEVERCGKGLSIDEIVGYG